MRRFHIERERSSWHRLLQQENDRCRRSRNDCTPTAQPLRCKSWKTAALPDRCAPRQNHTRTGSRSHTRLIDEQLGQAPFRRWQLPRRRRRSCLHGKRGAVCHRKELCGIHDRHLVHRAAELAAVPFSFCLSYFKWVCWFRNRDDSRMTKLLQVQGYCQRVCCVAYSDPTCRFYTDRLGPC